MTCSKVATLYGHEDWVSQAIFSPDGRSLVTHSNDGTLRVWDTTDWRQRRVLWEPCYHLEFLPDGRLMACYEDVFRWWTPDFRQETCTTRHMMEAVVLKFDAPVQRAAVGCRDGQIWLVDPQDWTLTRMVTGHLDDVCEMAFRPDGISFATAAPFGRDADFVVRVWDGESGQPVAAFEGHSDHIGALAFSPDGRHLASASTDGTVRIWDTKYNAEYQKLSHGAEVSTVSFSPNGRWLASATSHGEVKVWSTRSWKERVSLNGETDGVLSVAFAPDSALLSVARESGRVDVWRIAQD